MICTDAVAKFSILILKGHYFDRNRKRLQRLMQNLLNFDQTYKSNDVLDDTLAVIYQMFLDSVF
jgi:hypothetical protein